MVGAESRRDLSLYGVTPASTFLRLMSHPAVARSLSQCGGGDCVVVLGCSVGWACAYAAFALGRPSRGCDLLASRVEAGRAALQRCLRVPPPAPIELLAQVP